MCDYLYLTLLNLEAVILSSLNTLFRGVPADGNGRHIINSCTPSSTRTLIWLFKRLAPFIYIHLCVSSIMYDISHCTEVAERNVPEVSHTCFESFVHGADVMRCICNTCMHAVNHGLDCKQTRRGEGSWKNQRGRDKHKHSGLTRPFLRPPKRESLLAMG